MCVSVFVSKNCKIKNCIVFWDLLPETIFLPYHVMFYNDD